MEDEYSEESVVLDLKELLRGVYNSSEGDRCEPGGYVVHSGNASTYFGPDWDGVVRFARGMYGKNGRIEKMARLILQGHSTRAIRKEVGGSTNTIVKLRRVLEVIKGQEIACKCGLPARHSGFCGWRISQSAGRQRYLAECAAKSQRSNHGK